MTLSPTSLSSTTQLASGRGPPSPLPPRISNITKCGLTSDSSRPQLASTHETTLHNTSAQHGPELTNRSHSSGPERPKSPPSDAPRRLGLHNKRRPKTTQLEEGLHNKRQPKPRAQLERIVTKLTSAPGGLPQMTNRSPADPEQTMTTRLPNNPDRPTEYTSDTTKRLHNRRPDKFMGQSTWAPDGFPPNHCTRVSWDKKVQGGTGNKFATHIQHDMNGIRRDAAADERTAIRITNKDRLDRSTTGEFPCPRSRYLPSDVKRILPDQLVGPDDFFNPGPSFLANIVSLMRCRPPTPAEPPFRFGVTPTDLRHNESILAAANFDFTCLIPQHQGTTLGFGSEFRPLPHLERLLSRHPHFPFMARLLSSGMDYHFHDGGELSETERLVEMAGQLQRGNHKSVSQSIETVKELLAKDVKHGFTIPLPVECAPQIKGGMVQPLGLVKQCSLNEHNERISKFRITQDLSFSIDAEKDCSINGRVNLQRYPEMVYGWCMPRILHLVSSLREELPETSIFICKYDYSDAYRRIAHSPTATSQTIAVLEDIAYVSLRLTFGGSPNPPTWCAVSEIVTDLANEIAWCTEWDPKSLHSTMMTDTATLPKRVQSSVPFAPARPMAVRVPATSLGRVDVFVDDVIHVFPDTPGALERFPHVVPLAMELTSRVHAGTTEPIPRRPILSPEKLAAEGAPAEIQQVLGWTIDTRRLTVSLPKNKHDMWANDIKRVREARRASTELLATIEGRLNHTASILPMARHFLTRLRRVRIHAMSNNRPYVKLPDAVISDLLLWEQLLTITHHGISINLLTTRQPDIIGWSDACPFGMGGYNTSGRAWRLLIDPQSPIFGESRVNNVLEYIAMTVNAIVACHDTKDLEQPCVLALGDNTSAIGWLYRSSRLHQPQHAGHLQIARHLAHEVIRHNCCLYSQHIPGNHNTVADLLSYDGRGRDKHHPIAHDQPDDITLTRRFHAHYSQQITTNFHISPLPPDVDSWLRLTLQTLESFVTDVLNRPSMPPTELGDGGTDTALKWGSPTTQHWTNSTPQPDNSSAKRSYNTSDTPSGTKQAPPSLIACVRERFYRALSDKPSASWQRRVGSVAGRAPSTTRTHPSPSFPTSSSCCDHLPQGILQRRNNAQSHPSSYELYDDFPTPYLVT